MSFRLPDVLRRHHSTSMRYLQVKAVIFEEIIKVTALTAAFNSLGSDDMKYIERPEYMQRLINLNKQKTIG